MKRRKNRRDREEEAVHALTTIVVTESEYRDQLHAEMRAVQNLLREAFANRRAVRENYLGSNEAENDATMRIVDDATERNGVAFAVAAPLRFSHREIRALSFQGRGVPGSLGHLISDYSARLRALRAAIKEHDAKCAAPAKPVRVYDASQPSRYAAKKKSRVTETILK